MELSYLNHAPQLSSFGAELATAASVPSVIGSNSAISVQWTPAVVVNNGSATDGPVIRRCRFGPLWADEKLGSTDDKSEPDLHEYLSFPRDFVPDLATARRQRWIQTAPEGKRKRKLELALRMTQAENHNGVPRSSGLLSVLLPKRLRIDLSN